MTDCVNAVLRLRCSCVLTYVTIDMNEGINYSRLSRLMYGSYSVRSNGLRITINALFCKALKSGLYHTSLQRYVTILNICVSHGSVLT